jgi:hypothetical protein
LQEGYAAQTRFGFGIRLAAIVVLATILLPTILLAALILTVVMLAAVLLAAITLATVLLAAILLATVILAAIILAPIILAIILLPLVRGVALAVGRAIGLRLVGLAILLLGILLLTFLAAFAPLVGARHEATLALDDTEIVIGILPIGLGLDAITHGPSLAGQRLVLFVDLMGIAAHAHIRTAAIENLISIWRPIRIVVVLLLVLIVIAAAAAVTAAARTLTIVGSH